jgi:hypothetical protein
MTILSPRDLAAKMLEWGELKERMLAIEQEISDSVAMLQKTQTVGNVRATYSNGRGTWDYKGAFVELTREEELNVIDDYLNRYSTKTIVEDIDWKGMVYEITKKRNIPLDDKYYTPGNPSVKVKILEPGGIA